MRRLLAFALLIAPLALLPGAAAASGGVPTTYPAAALAAPAAQGDAAIVDVVKVGGALDRPMFDYLVGTLEQAEADGATVVLQLDSPGALNGDVSRLIDRFVRSEVPVVAWVGPAPARAGGGAMLLLYTSSVSAVAPGVAIGPFLPWDLAEPSCADETCADPEAAVRAWRALRGLEGDVAFPEVESPAQTAIDGGFAQVTAASIPDLLQQLDGVEVPTADGPVTLATESREGRPVEVRFRDLGPGRRVLHAVAAPTAIYVLLVLGLALLAFEATQPGFGFAGFSGVGMLALAVYGLTIVPFAVVGLLLLLLGVGLQSADVAVRRLGALTFAGLTSFAAGSVLVFRDAAPAIDVSLWLMAGAVVASFLYYGFGLTVAVRSRERITSTQRGLVGLVGEARSDLDPEGSVYVKGTLWRGRSGNGSIPKGTRIRVRGVDGLVLRVDPEPGGRGGAEPGEARQTEPGGREAGSPGPDEPPNPRDRGITET